jgi:hypothetical protein
VKKYIKKAVKEYMSGIETVYKKEELKKTLWVQEGQNKAEANGNF